MNPRRAAEGHQVEEIVILIVQCHGEAFRAAYMTIIYYGLKQLGRLQQLPFGERVSRWAKRSFLHSASIDEHEDGGSDCSPLFGVRTC